MLRICNRHLSPSTPSTRVRNSILAATLMWGAVAAVAIFLTGFREGNNRVTWASPAAPRDADESDDAPANWVRISSSGNYRYVESNGIPAAGAGRFPNADCPNPLLPQRYRFRLPLSPRFLDESTAVGMNLFGVAVDGIPFDAAAAEWWKGDPNSGWQYEALTLGPRLGLDANNAHVQPTGAYHYHGLPTALLKALRADDRMTLIGWAADGFPIYGPSCYSQPNDPDSKVIAMWSSYRLKRGRRPGGRNGYRGPGGRHDGTFVQDYEFIPDSGDLDECNGRTGVTPEYPEGTYYYVISLDWPVIPRKLRGTGDASFLHRPPHHHPGRFH